MNNIQITEILARAQCLEDDNTGDQYNKSYQHFIDYFSSREILTEHDLVIAANFTYGWMQTILNFKSHDFELATQILNKAKTSDRISSEEIIVLKQLFNNSLVGASKLLHFVNPDIYAVWDSRVCYFLTGKPYSQKVENIGLYWSYLDLCVRVSSHQSFSQIHENHIAKLGFNITPMRTVEQIMFISSNDPIQN